MRFVEFRRRVCLYDLYGLHSIKGLSELYGIDEEGIFMTIRGKVSLRDLWPSRRDSLHEESAFIIFVGLMRRAPLRRVPL